MSGPTVAFLKHCLRLGDERLHQANLRLQKASGSELCVIAGESLANPGRMWREVQTDLHEMIDEYGDGEAVASVLGLKK